VQGGSLEPEHYFMYMGDKIEYLCYTNEYYQTCVVQQPMLKQHIERELQNSIKDKVDLCFDELKISYEKKGYIVDLKKGDTKVELLLKRIDSNFEYEITLTKDSSEKYEEFNIILNNNLYELVGVVNNILKWESTYGDADPTIYMDYYRDLKVDKFKQDDGSTIYILTDRNNRRKFQFASRSVAWPPGI